MSYCYPLCSSSSPVPYQVVACAYREKRLEFVLQRQKHKEEGNWCSGDSPPLLPSR